ncbi:MAG: hypothetical protein ACO1RT_17460 [Planctomycetaceae bacterium]
MSRTEALKSRKQGLLRTMGHNRAWIAAGIMVASVGCKVGNPLDRTVRVTQQPSRDALDLPSPQTRLASSSIQRDPEASVAQTSAVDASEPSPHESRRRGSAEPRTTVARKAPPTSTTSRPKESSSQAGATNPVSKASASAVPAEHAELLEAFRDSPPEVQQQALRQLIAVTGHKAPKTDSPKGITEILQSSVDDLPALPEDAVEPVSLPSRLGTGEAQTELASEVVQASAEADPQPSAEDQIALASGESIEPNDLQRNVQNAAMPVGDDAPDAGAEPKPLLTSVADAELYAELAKRLERPAAGESEADAYRRQIIARHLMMFAGNPDGAVAAFEGMKPTEQNFLRHYLLGLWSMIDTHGHPVAARRWSAALPEIRQATQQLSASAESLDVRSLAFCKEIQSFGQVTAFESQRFEAGQKVILYCEIDNFLAESTPDGFETHLQGSYEIFDSKDQKVAGQVLPADKQLCANYLRDYFIAYQMNLPANLEAGDYRLELTMECLKGQKYGQASIPLSIAPAAAR